MRPRLSAFLAIAILAAVAAAAVPPQPAHATWPGSRGLIAYGGGGFGDEIHVVRPDGSGDRLLTKSRSGEFKWSRDGNELAFAYAEDGLAIVRADGTHRRTLVPPAAIFPQTAATPAWAPDGRRIVFTGRDSTDDEDTGVEETFHLLVVRRDGTHLRRLGRGHDPVWTPRGNRILYAQDDGDIASIKPNGKRRKVVKRQKGFAGWLDLSPNGRRLAYSWWPGGRGTGHRTLDLRTGKATKVARKRVHGTVVWNPGGRRLAFIQTRRGDVGRPPLDRLRTMRRDGSHRVTVFDMAGIGSPKSGLAWQTR